MNQLFKRRRDRLHRFQDLTKKDKGLKVSKPIDEMAIEVCPQCKQAIHSKELALNLYVCPLCEAHFSLSAHDRILSLVDPKSFKELWAKAKSNGINKFPDYEDKLIKYQDATHLNEAVVCGTAKIAKIKIALAVMDNRFMMGSMGQIVGEKITRLIEYANFHKLPLIIFTASGGARMQEGILSLMQMAKTSAALARFSENNGFYCTVLTHPTTGGVSASFAMLGDIILAEPKALVGFAGRRVIEKTVKEQLPDDFQTSEFLLDKGFIDRIVHRKDLRQTLTDLLLLHQEPQS